MLSCDDCKYYNWYYDWCDRWKVKIDERAVNNCFTPREEDKNNDEHREEQRAV